MSLAKYKIVDLKCFLHLYFLFYQRTASLAKTLDQVIEVFSSVSKKKTATSSPLPDSSNWKTIQKLVLPIGKCFPFWHFY